LDLILDSSFISGNSVFTIKIQHTKLNKVVLPVYVYGQPVLKKKGRFITEDELPQIKELVENMFETMYASHGVGLAAQQIGKDLRLFVMDTIQLGEDADVEKPIKQAFLNAEKVEEDGDFWTYEEGCLSFPEIRGNVDRPEKITIRYRDLDFKEHIETFDGFNARVMQHEYDHTMGELFIEKFKPLKRRMLKKKLDKIKAGEVDAAYPIRVYRK
jgi:peptide deformylase